MAENIIKSIVELWIEMEDEVKPLLERCDSCKSYNDYLSQLQQPCILTCSEIVIEGMFDQSAVNCKSDSKSLESRHKGNAHFVVKEFDKAHYFYCKAIRAATIPSTTNSSKELSLAFANRSAANFALKQYQAAIHDIDFAIEAGYPQNKLEKLEQRRLWCLHEMKRATKADEREEENDRILVGQKLESFDPATPFASTKIQVAWNTKKGFHIIAAQDIEFGELIIIEEAFAKLMLPNDHNANNYCHHCFKNLEGAGIPCLRCDEVLFCSINCRLVSDSEYHLKECRFLYSLFALDPRIMIVARILTKTGTDRALEIWRVYKQKVKKVKEKCPSIYARFITLNYEQDTGEDLRHSAIGAIFLRIWLEKQDSSGCTWTTQKRRQLEQIILIHIFQVGHHSHITGSKFLTISDETQMISEPGFGYGLFPFASMVSLAPETNVITYHHGTEIRVFTTKGIKAGQEILFSYHLSFLNSYMNTYKCSYYKYDTSPG